MPFRFSLFAAFISFCFLEHWRQLSLLRRLEITVFSRNIKFNVKLIYTSRLQISWRHIATEYAGLISDQTTCSAKIQECGVLWNTWIRGKKATLLDNGQICLAMVNYTKIIDYQTLGRPIQVNGALYSIKKRHVIIKNTFHLCIGGDMSL